MSGYTRTLKNKIYLVLCFILLTSSQISFINAEPERNQETKPSEILQIDSRLIQNDPINKILQEDSSIIYGPQDGDLWLQPGESTWFRPNVQVSDFIAEVTFYNPYSIEKNAWEYGIAFRGNSGRWLLLSIYSQSTWQLQCGISNDYTYPGSGNLTNLDLSPTGMNLIQLRAKGDQGELFVNSDYIASLDLSCTSGAGDVSLYAGPAMSGEVTRFSGFTIKENEISPRIVGNESQDRDFEITTGDSDMDGLEDEFEKAVMNAFKPKFVYDEEEHNIILDQEPEDFGQFSGVVFLHQVSMASCKLNSDGDPVYASFSNLDISPRPRTVLLTIVAIYPYDYLPWKDTAYLYKAGEEDILAHHGDIETMKICVGKVANTEAEYAIDFIHIRRHGEDHVYSLGELEKEFDGTINHPVLYVSEGKHATYSSEDECENSLPFYQDFFWDEDCGPKNGVGKVIWPAEDFIYNVGEYYPEKSNTLEDFGLADHIAATVAYDNTDYVKEYVWTSQFEGNDNRQAYFCGGFNILNYYDEHQVKGAYFAENCPGGLHAKWWSQQTVPMEGVLSSTCLEQDTDRYGSDYAYFDMSNPDPYECMQACVDDVNCVSFTYLSPGLQAPNARCYLKNTAPSPSQMVGAISGLRSNCQ